MIIKKFRFLEQKKVINIFKKTNIHYIFEGTKLFRMNLQIPIIHYHKNKGVTENFHLVILKNPKYYRKIQIRIKMKSITTYKIFINYKK